MAADLTGPPAVHYTEVSARPRVESEPLAHLSVEVGHLYHDDLAGDDDELRARFAEVAPWLATATAARPGKRLRVSTCLLLDDYSGPVPSPPGELIPRLLRAAGAAGVRIDYLAREAACAGFGGTSPARLALARVVDEPPREHNGGRPPTTETGWLANGTRAVPAGEAAAFSGRPGWQPPVESAAAPHSVFVDVQLWDGPETDRRYSCAMLAATWQLLRLGVLRDHGKLVARPVPVPPQWPARWELLPPLIQLAPDAAGFAAYRTLTIMSPRFLPTEAAVRTVLGQIQAEAAVAELVAERARGERVRLPADLVGRVNYVFAALDD
jgi:hypothetical protein